MSKEKAEKAKTPEERFREQVGTVSKEVAEWKGRHELPRQPKQSEEEYKFQRRVALYQLIVSYRKLLLAQEQLKKHLDTIPRKDPALETAMESSKTELKKYETLLGAEGPEILKNLATAVEQFRPAEEKMIGAYDELTVARRGTSKSADPKVTDQMRSDALSAIRLMNGKITVFEQGLLSDFDPMSENGKKALAAITAAREKRGKEEVGKHEDVPAKEIAVVKAELELFRKYNGLVDALFLATIATDKDAIREKLGPAYERTQRLEAQIKDMEEQEIIPLYEKDVERQANTFKEKYPAIYAAVTGEKKVRINTLGEAKDIASRDAPFKKVFDIIVARQAAIDTLRARQKRRADMMSVVHPLYRQAPEPKKAPAKEAPKKSS